MMRSSGLLSPRLWIHLVILRPLLRLLFGVNLEGKEHLADLDQFIIVANHNSHLDILLLFDMLPVRHILTTRPVAARDYFGTQPILFRAVDYLFRPIWIVRGEKGDDSLEKMGAALDAGTKLIIFPEGTRGVPGRIERFRTGIGRLAERHRKVPTIPVFLSGPERSFPKGSAFPLPIWNRITVGPPRLFESAPTDFTISLETVLRELSESESANRHRRVKRTRMIFSVALLGIDGSGKSTVSARVAGELSRTQRVCRVSDRLEFFERGEREFIQSLPAERLRQILTRYAKTAKSLRHYKLPKLAELLLRDRLMEEVQRWYAPEMIVLDGSPLLNLMAWARLYKGEAFSAETCSAAIRVLTCGGDPHSLGNELRAKLPELARLSRLRLARLRLPDAAIMLDVEPALSVSRIQSRGGPTQVHETEQMLEKLRGGYRMVCRVAEEEFGVPTLILDGHVGLEQITRSAVSFLEEIHERRHLVGSTRY